MRRALTVAAAGLALALAGCTPDTGVVYDKKVQVKQECIEHGVHTCSKYIDVKTWYLCLEDGEGNKGCKKVSETDYNKYEKDQRYP